LKCRVMYDGCPIIQAKQRVSEQEKARVRENERLATTDAVRSAIVVKRKRKCKR
jgi:hypothetical protein